MRNASGSDCRNSVHNALSNNNDGSRGIKPGGSRMKNRHILFKAALVAGFCAAVAGCYIGYGEGSVGIGIGPSPDIAGQPQSVAVFVGDTASFGVSVISVSQIDYQWRRNGVAIFGANDGVYRATSVTLNDNGALYSVRVCNTFGCTTSSNAALTVIPR